jgi:hypothetical protein
MGTMSKGYLTLEIRNILEQESKAVAHLDQENAFAKMAEACTVSLEQLFRLHFEPTFNEGTLEQDITINGLENENNDLKAEVIAMEDFAAQLKNNEKIMLEANNKLQDRLSKISDSKANEILWLRSVIEKAVK